jgi:uncharacterized membrane protein
MKPFFVLIFTFIIGYSINRLIGNEANLASAGCIAMAVMLVFTSIAHFKFLNGMMMMVPSFIPFKKEMVIVTGFVEIAAAAGLCIISMRHITSIWLIIFFILMLPANINAAIKHVDYEKGTPDGKGLKYLWFRVPLQIFFIVWVWYFGIYLF